MAEYPIYERKADGRRAQLLGGSFRFGDGRTRNDLAWLDGEGVMHVTNTDLLQNWRVLSDHNSGRQE